MTENKESEDDKKFKVNINPNFEEEKGCALIIVALGIAMLMYFLGKSLLVYVENKVHVEPPVPGTHLKDKVK